MTARLTYLDTIRAFIKKVDWPLLVFLLLLVNVKIVVKLIALLVIYILRPSASFGWMKGRLPLFYLALPFIGLLNYCLYAGFHSLNYSVAFVTGIIFWVLCMLACHQVKLAVERSPTEKIHATITLFLLLNVIVSFVNILLIDLEIGEWNPYTFQGMYQKYFIGTGDYIKGISFDTSNTNAVINLAGVCYFLFRQQFAFALCCMAALLLTGSNFVNITCVAVFACCFIFQSSRDQKSVMVVCILLLVLFLAKISPQNNDYAMKTAAKLLHKPISKVTNVVAVPVEQRPDSALTAEQKKYKFAKLYLDSISTHLIVKDTAGTWLQQRPSLPVANIHSAPYQHKRDSSLSRGQLAIFAKNIGRDTGVLAERSIAERTPGKLLAIQETFQYLGSHPRKIPMGSGIGNFSSKLAFRTTGLQLAGGYPKKYIYVNNDFLNNHLAILVDYFDKDTGFHSITNTPNSAYLQVLSEYGVFGMAALLLLYVGFFLKGIRRNSYALPLLLVLSAVLLVDYWFEQLSVIPLFELLLFLDQKDKNKRLIYAV